MATLLTIDNSFSQIQGLSAEQMKALRKILSYSNSPQAAYYSKFGPKISYLIDKKGFFPSGLLPRVRTFLIKNNISYISIKKNTSPTKIVNHGANITRVPYDAQINALEAAVLKGRGILSLPTGSGKSLVIALLIAKFGLRTLIVVPNLELKQQLTADLTKQFHSMANITIENIDSRALAKHTNFDMLIVDECHHVAAKTYHTLNKKAWTGIYHRFMLTATPFRNQKEETLLFEALAGSVIYELTYSEAVNQGYIVPIEAYYVDVPKQATEAYTYAQVYNQLVVNNEARNNLLALILLRLNANGCSTLCLVKEINHGATIENLTNIPFANGQDEESRVHIKDFAQGTLTSMIGTTGIVGEGVDTLPCEYVIIGGLGKAKSAFLQQVGRGVRKYGNKTSCKVIIFRDPSHKFTIRHYREQVKILKEYYNCTPTKLEL